ncbi:MAG: Na+/H+ antiporter [Anaerolineaceae bacterium]|nr:Na+/H+ antiporter [Anaerolineaceae bacterium]
MEQFIQTEAIIIGLLLVVALVAMIVRRLRIPYIVTLVAAGLFLTLRSPFRVELTPELILTLFVPPLVFEAAFHLNLNELRHNLSSILTFAVPGVILTTLIVGGILALTGSASLPLAFLFGALISATDPLAVVATFRKLGVPARLTVLIEGESLLNDGTAIVMFNLMLAVVLTGHFDLLSSAVDFVRVAVGGVIIGLGLGWIVSALIERVDDYLVEMTLTTVLAFGSYLLAEQLQLSGVLAVVAAGLVNGNLGSRGMSPTSRIMLSNTWEYIAFLANSVVFLLIGLQGNLPDLGSAWRDVLAAILAVLAARVVIVYGLGWLINQLSTRPAPASQKQLPLKWQHVLSWSGLRGAISLALVLSLPASLGSQRDILRLMAFGVVLFTLLIQSTSMWPLIRWLRIVTQSEAQVEYEMNHARLTSLRMADSRIDRLYSEGLLSPHAWEKLKQFVTQQAETLLSTVRDLLQADPELESQELEKGWRELFRSQRSALVDLRRDGVIKEEVYEKLTAEIDAQLIEGYPTLPEDGPVRTQFLDVTIPEQSQAAGKTVAEIGLPRGAVFVSIRRGDTTYIPRGDTQLLPGDVVTTLCVRECVPEIKDLLLSAAGPGK